MKITYLFWIPISFYSFYILPLKYRSLLACVTCFVYDVFISYATHNNVKEAVESFSNNMDTSLNKGTKQELKQKLKQDNEKLKKELRKLTRKGYWREVRALSWANTKSSLHYALGTGVLLMSLTRSVLILPTTLAGYCSIQLLRAYYQTPSPK